MRRNDVTPSPIDRDHLQRLVAEGAQLVEVLPDEEYRDEHLPGAIHLPDVMEPGPATVRADADLTDTTERIQRRGTKSLIVSTPDGVLLGVLRTEPRPP
jgi:hypothetical protein